MASSISDSANSDEIMTDDIPEPPSADELSYTVIHLRKPGRGFPNVVNFSILRLPTDNPGNQYPPSSPFEAALFQAIGKEIADNYTELYHHGSSDPVAAETLGKESVQLSDSGAFANIMRFLMSGPEAEMHDVRIYWVQHNTEPQGVTHYLEDDKVYLVAGSPAIYEDGHEKEDTSCVCEISIDGSRVDLGQGAWEWDRIIGPESGLQPWYREEKGVEEKRCSLGTEPWDADAEERLEEDREFARRLTAQQSS